MLSNTISKYFLLVLLVTSFSLGILLAMTIGERNTAASNYEHAKAVIEEKDSELEQEKAEKNASQEDFKGCRASLEILSRKNEEQSFASREEEVVSQGRADSELSKLPEKIAQDRVSGQGPVLATRWMKELFK